ncbi:MAG: T9SS type A sorting domain-containing protein [Hyphomicrobiales bacterium]
MKRKNLLFIILLMIVSFSAGAQEYKVRKIRPGEYRGSMVVTKGSHTILEPGNYYMDPDDYIEVRLGGKLTVPKGVIIKSHIEGEVWQGIFVEGSSHLDQGAIHYYEEYNGQYLQLKYRYVSPQGVLRVNGAEISGARHGIVALSRREFLEKENNRRQGAYRSVYTTSGGIIDINNSTLFNMGRHNLRFFKYEYESYSKICNTKIQYNTAVNFNSHEQNNYAIIIVGVNGIFFQKVIFEPNELTYSGIRSVMKGHGSNIILKDCKFYNSVNKFYTTDEIKVYDSEFIMNKNASYNYEDNAIYFSNIADLEFKRNVVEVPKFGIELSRVASYNIYGNTINCKLENVASSINAGLRLDRCNPVEEIYGNIIKGFNVGISVKYKGGTPVNEGQCFICNTFQSNISQRDGKQYTIDIEYAPGTMMASHQGILDVDNDEYKAAANRFTKNAVGDINVMNKFSVRDVNYYYHDFKGNYYYIVDLLKGHFIGYERTTKKSFESYCPIKGKKNKRVDLSLSNLKNDLELADNKIEYYRSQLNALRGEQKQQAKGFINSWKIEKNKIIRELLNEISKDSLNDGSKRYMEFNKYDLFERYEGAGIRYEIMLIKYKDQGYEEAVRYWNTIPERHNLDDYQRITYFRYKEYLDALNNLSSITEIIGKDNENIRTLMNLSEGDDDVAEIAEDYLNSIRLDSYKSETSVSNVETYSMDIYPNPATDKLYIDFKGNSSEDMNINLYNTVGQLVRSYEYANGTQVNTISLSGIDQGVYLVSVVKDGKKLTTKKIIIK